MLTIADKILILDYDLTPIVLKMYRAFISFPPFETKRFGPACISIIKKPVQVVGQLDPRGMLLGEDAGSTTSNALSAALFRCMDYHWRNHLNGGRRFLNMRTEDEIYSESLFGENLMYGLAAQEWEAEIPALFLSAISIALIRDKAVAAKALDIIHAELEKQPNPCKPLLVPLLNHARSL